ncbi:unnamed protein product [Fusarium fujikuroi]|nr:unnamed protein product [Fusarium fujikuroi]
MTELELRSTHDDIHSQAQPQLWGKQIQEAPQCITLMAKCKLLLSKASMEGLEVSPNGPEQEPLLVVMGRFCRMGESTFRSTATRMKAVGRLTHDMWKLDGTDIVAEVKDGDDRVLIKDLTAQDIDDMNDDPQLKKDYLRDVSLMKERLSIASRATGLYTELSDKFILPAIDWVGTLSTLNLSDKAYGEMELQISAKRLELSEGAEQLVMKRVAEIGIELKARCPQATVTELADDDSEEFEERVNTQV